MNKYTKKDIMRIVEEEDVQFIKLQFTDIFGTLKNVAISKSQLTRALDGECMFDGSSIEGFARIEESDMYLRPDLNSFTILPWRPQTGKVARIICDVYDINGKPYQGDPRGVLKKIVNEGAEMGYTFMVGPELEFFLFDFDENGKPILDSNEKAGYFDLGPVDYGENTRRDIVLTMEQMGVEIEASHHENAPCQHEIDIKYEPALKLADDFMTFKLAVKSVAQKNNKFASFMPKPRPDVAGSGVHLNMSIQKDGKNLFFDENGKYGLSKEAYYFIGGIMSHIKGITLFTNPIVNSYKRLIPGYEAPVDIAWSYSNRTPLIRIPKSHEHSKRIELRNPDPSMNPYLALAVCIAAGLDGIKNKINPPAEVQLNVFDLTDMEKETLEIGKMPSSLAEAIEGFESDMFIRNVVGSHIAKQIIRMKKQEWTTYRSQVTGWELDEYLYKL
ncbi:MAG: type I glutamate--ammonia ligase [Lachnospiraceae bacterium]|nr:type I glutamate--ammonia ligase [Lachnospiraceae bacterium]